MNKEFVVDVLKVYFDTLGLTDKHLKSVIYRTISRRCEMYKDTNVVLKSPLNGEDNFLIKPNNGVYTLEEFLLNRLMLGLRNIDLKTALEGNGGEYIAYHKDLAVNVKALEQEIKTLYPNLLNNSGVIIDKTIHHELGHCLKTEFGGSYRAPVGDREQDNIYEKLIINLKKYNNGKYANRIKDLTELNNSDEYSTPVKTGAKPRKRVTNAYIDSNYKYMDYTLFDEMMNETEALAVANHDIIFKRHFEGSKGNYINYFNGISGYRRFTGYGTIFNYIIGKKAQFTLEYLDADPVFKYFDKNYDSIAQEIFGGNMHAMEYVIRSVDIIKKRKKIGSNVDLSEQELEEVRLNLDYFLARCFEQKVDKKFDMIKSNEDIQKKILKELDEMQLRLTNNIDQNKNNELKHIKIFNKIRNRIKNLSVYDDLMNELDNNDKVVDLNECFELLDKIANRMSIDSDCSEYIYQLGQLEIKYNLAGNRDYLKIRQALINNHNIDEYNLYRDSYVTNNSERKK